MARKRRSAERAQISFPYTVIVPVACYRKWPDPVFPEISHHSGYVPSLMYPDAGFPNDPNLRPANIDRKIYQTIAESLLNQDCTPNAYHLKSKGEIQAAAVVKEVSPTATREWFEENVAPLVADDEDLLSEFQKKYVLLEITYKKGQGILDGGHTDQIWSDEENRVAIRESYGADSDSEERNQNHLPIEWTTGIPDELVSEIVGGRNTAMQVQNKTLANHELKFDWIKELIADEPYADKIAFRENEPRSEKPVDIRELLALITPFNRDLFGPGKKSPVTAFSQKEKILSYFIDDQEDDGDQTYSRLHGIMKDILALHDLIQLEAVNIYNETKNKNGQSGRGGKFAFVEYRESKKPGKRTSKAVADRFKLWFLPWEDGEPQVSDYHLADGALYPMLAAFSALVRKDAIGNFTWSPDDGFEGVLKIWRSLAHDFMESTGNQSNQVGRNPAQIGKSSNHWEFLYMKVQLTAQS